MNFYPHHLGDYAKDTKHLSVTEHGAYRLLMDHYYSTETSLPENFKALFRICGASSQAERDSIRKVIGDFFILEDHEYKHKRIEHELDLYSQKVEKNKENGKKGGRPPKRKPKRNPTDNRSLTQSITQTEPNENPEGTLSNNQYPITKEYPSGVPPEVVNGKEKLPSRHTQILKFWKDEFKTHFGTDYSYHETRQFRELQTLLDSNPELSVDEFMDVANDAWRASGDKFRTAVKQGRTITGLCQNWNAIRAEIEVGRNPSLFTPKKRNLTEIPCT